MVWWVSWGHHQAVVELQLLLGAFSLLNASFLLHALGVVIIGRSTVVNYLEILLYSNQLLGSTLVG